MKTFREYLEILDEINRRDFLKATGAATGLAAMGGASAAWQKEPDIPQIQSGTAPVTGPVANYKNTSSDGATALVAYKNPASAGIKNINGTWYLPRRRSFYSSSPADSTVTQSGTIKIDNGPTVDIEFHNVSTKKATIVSSDGIAGDEASQKIANSILNAKQKIIIDANSLGGGILEFTI